MLSAQSPLLSLDVLPDNLRQPVTQAWSDWLDHANTEDIALLQQHPIVFNSLPKVWACSSFVAKHCSRHPALLSQLLREGGLQQAVVTPLAQLSKLCPPDMDETSLMAVLRQFRQREMVRIAWRDLAGWAQLEETLQALSDLADATLEIALQHGYRKWVQTLGTPCNTEGEAQSLIVLAMGKLGGQELNFSSDIDLIFAYPQAGETQGAQRARSNQEFFIRVGQYVINVLGQITADGFVFRVDMRLRPFGDSGPLAMSFEAMEEYYQNNARDWERYAMVKARVAAGDKEQGQQLLDMLQPFVYRRYLDYNAFEALRTMKAMIDEETRRRGRENNIKRGAGGIREVEFTCQVFQLIRGGRQPSLQQRHLLLTLNRLAHEHCLPADEVQQLRDAYIFLRMTENHLQAIDDQQTQILPDDEVNQLRLAFSMSFSGWADFLAALHIHQQVVHTRFEQVICPESAPVSESQRDMLLAGRQALWLTASDEAMQTDLQVAGFSDPPKAVLHLRQLRNARGIQHLSRRGQERLDTLIPLLLNAVAEQENRDETLFRLLNLLEAVAQRSVYLALLIERPAVLQELVRLCGQSAWIATQISRYPLLLDELLQYGHLSRPPVVAELDDALQAQLQYLPEDDLEMRMDNLRQFKRAHVLRTAAAELSGGLSVEAASDYLAAIADTLVKQALKMAYYHLVQRHGQPVCLVNGKVHIAGFCIAAYGKAGGIELSYGSDLDIVFLHDSQGDRQMTDGDRPLENTVFFVRLAQRIMHILTTITPSGTLYEVDPRLRPGGSSGLLVSSFDNFLSYQKQEAWTWEHQALVRARAMAGDEHCMTQFEMIRREIVSQHREPAALRQDICNMRNKMRQHLDKSRKDIFDIKQGPGGVTDIEFMVQYLTLCHAAGYPDLLHTTGILPLLRLMEQHHLLDSEACQVLSDAYRVYRAETHRLALSGQPAQVNQTCFVKQREQISFWWQQLMQV